MFLLFYPQLKQYVARQVRFQSGCVDPLDYGPLGRPLGTLGRDQDLDFLFNLAVWCLMLVLGQYKLRHICFFMSNSTLGVNVRVA